MTTDNLERGTFIFYCKIISFSQQKKKKNKINNKNKGTLFLGEEFFHSSFLEECISQCAEWSSPVEEHQDEEEENRVLA